MTKEERAAIDAALAKVPVATENINRAGEQLKAAGLASATQERLQELYRIYQQAVHAHSLVCDEVDDAFRAAGINVPRAKVSFQ